MSRALSDQPHGSVHEFQRPKYHITAPFWMNDPCAPGYDDGTGLYHLFFQCNPHGCEWGNMSWAHVVSEDLVYWRYASNPVPLKPDREYDKEGVFTGCMGPIKADVLTIFYSSICRLPFHWSLAPYPRGAASLAAATSIDGGETWVKHERNPILPEEPQGILVSGFRDPYLAEWPAMDKLRDCSRSLYGLISGGVQGCGPTTFLYACNPDDLQEWTYLGPLVDMPLRFQPSPKWSHNYGCNWECVNFMTLHSEIGSVARHFLILGSEGDSERNHIKEHVLPPDLPPRTVRSQQWLSGELTKDSNSGDVRLKYRYGGLIDHGSCYAANSFHDPRSQRRIVFGWIPEEDMPSNSGRRKGWNGTQAMPRELFLLSISRVVRALSSPLESITCVELESTPSDVEVVTVHTLGVRPVPELSVLHSRASRHHRCDRVTLPTATECAHRIVRLKSANFNLTAVVKIDPLICTSVGIHLRHSTSLAMRTTVIFSLVDETIIVDRSCSTRTFGFNTCREQGPFTLFTIRDAESESDVLEKLNLSIFGDGDVLEVFANDRFALATTYYSGSSVQSNHVSVFAEGKQAAAIFEDVQVWDGLNGGESTVSGLAVPK